MDGQEIFAFVKNKEKQIEDLIDPTTFVLNPEIAKLQKEIDEVRANCKHSFVSGVCEYCGSDEE